MRSMVEGASILCPLRLASLATSPATRGRNRSIATPPAGEREFFCV
jgi:hypothetical protein